MVPGHRNTFIHPTKKHMNPTPGFQRPCLTCGTLARASYCDTHKPQPTRNHHHTTKRKAHKTHLYGGTYRARAKHVRNTAQTCHICGEGGRGPRDPWEADHVTPALGSQSQLLPAHRSCNRQRGNKPITTHTHTNPPTPPPTTGQI